MIEKFKKKLSVMLRGSFQANSYRTASDNPTFQDDTQRRELLKDRRKKNKKQKKKSAEAMVRNSVQATDNNGTAIPASTTNPTFQPPPDRGVRARERERRLLEDDAKPLRLRRELLEDDELAREKFDKRIEEDCVIAKWDERYNDYMVEIAKLYLSESEKPFPLSKLQKIKPSISPKFGALFFIELFSRLIKTPLCANLKECLLRALKVLITPSTQDHLGIAPIVSLAAWETYKVFQSNLHEEISLARMTKKIFDICLASFCFYVFGSLGYSLGVLLVEPYLGTVLAAIIASLAAIYITALLDLPSQWVLRIPREEKIEAAYAYFDVDIEASNAEVNSAYRHVCQKNLPEKNGSRESLDKTFAMMRIITETRGFRFF